jgi:hypothetical protein
VISFHSLEDRIVKHFFREQAKGCTCPPDFPICVCGSEPELRLLTRKPCGRRRASSSNPRAASARLRAAVKADAPCADAAPRRAARGRAVAPRAPATRRSPRRRLDRRARRLLAASSPSTSPCCS